MEIIVCAKQVPDTTEAELKISEDKKSVKIANLPLDINEWDNYALEEAILIKEKFSGFVRVITIGSSNADTMLRMCLAKGADEAVRIDTVEQLDGYLTSLLLAQAIKEQNYKFDLILTGVQSSDYAQAQVGGMLAELLNVPHTTIVTKIELEGKSAKVERELEGGTKELLIINLPAVFTVQSGINEPRYASMLGIKRASAKEIKLLRLGELKPKVVIENLFIPPKLKKAEILTGGLDEATAKLSSIIKEKGLLR
ncbi:MAG: electron transfer flavoprotein subunit beta/FixA family protein [Candidatus Thermoplasmatota archaeon]|nr:electron transfer flavoprotein subunit beta/FixA family protein [Candidatus Thermoplasmatota archaeon]